ncbi:MAG: TonB-dependent receptor, partial [Bacteroidota bacterium]
LPVAHHQVCPDIEDKFYPDSNIYIYGNTNEQRMKDYHRFDLCTHFKKKKKKGIRIWTISVYNTYNRKNPYFYFSEIKDGKMQLYQQSLFPIIPSISYSYKF